MPPLKILLPTLIAILLTLVSFRVFDINIGQLFIIINVLTSLGNSTLPPAQTPTAIGEGAIILVACMNVKHWHCCKRNEN